MTEDSKLREILDEVAKLEGWLTFSEAARRLGVTRQAVFGMVAREELTVLRRVGDHKPIYLVGISNVDGLVSVRARADERRRVERATKERKAPKRDVRSPRPSLFDLVDPLKE